MAHKVHKGLRCMRFRKVHGKRVCADYVRRKR